MPPRHRAEVRHAVDGLLAVGERVHGAVQVLHGAAVGLVEHHRDLVAVEAERGGVLGQQALERLGELAQRAVAERMVVERVDAREVVEPQQQDAARGALAGEQAVEHLQALAMGEQARGGVHLALALQAGDGAREQHGRDFAVAHEQPAAHDPDVLALAVAHLVLQVVLVGLAAEHVVDGLVEALAVAIRYELAPPGDESLEHASGQVEVLLHVLGHEGHVRFHVDDVEVVVRAVGDGIVEQAWVEVEGVQRFIRIHAGLPRVLLPGIQINVDRIVRSIGLLGEQKAQGEGFRRLRLAGAPASGFQQGPAVAVA